VAEVARLKRKVDSQAANLARHWKQFEALKRQRAGAVGLNGNSDTWCHVIHPVWSLDPLPIPFRNIRTRLSFAPEQVPLSRIRPASAVSPALLPWRVNRNSDGGVLRSGGRRYAWGFGVHAPSELSFILPPHARSFRCGLGLDGLVKKGGCARARIYLGSARERPLYESPLMVGSQKTADTGWISLPPATDFPRRLILQADPAARDYPPNAAPLNIRDKLDWLDPLMALEPGGVRSEVGKLVAAQITASRRWTVRLDKPDACAWTSWFDRSAGPGGRFMTAVRPAGQPLILSREAEVGRDDKWLIVDGRYTTGEDLHAASVTLRAADTVIPAQKIPVKQLWMRRGPPLIFPITAYKGRKVTFELKLPAGGNPLCWHSIGMAGELPVAHRLARTLENIGKAGAQVPPGLALVLASDRVSKQHKQVAFEIHRLGGEINFTSQVTAVFRVYRPGEFEGGRLVTAMIGCEWTGGDDGLKLLEKLPGLRFLILTGSSGVSKQAAGRLKAAMPHLRIFGLHKSPSAWYGIRCYITVRNRGGKEVALFWHHHWGGLHEFARIKPGGQIDKLISGVGARYEAHLVTTKDHNKAKPVSRFITTLNTAWEIKGQ